MSDSVIGSQGTALYCNCAYCAQYMATYFVAAQQVLWLLMTQLFFSHTIFFVVLHAQAVPFAFFFQLAICSSCFLYFSGCLLGFVVPSFPDFLNIILRSARECLLSYVV